MLVVVSLKVYCFVIFFFFFYLLDAIIDLRATHLELPDLVFRLNNLKKM